MINIPLGWATATISDITEYLSRGKQPKYTNYSTLPVINQRAIRWTGIQNEYLKYVDPLQFDLWEPERFIQVGDILWNSTGTGTLGRACLVTERDLEPPKVVDSHVTILRPNKTAIDPRYLFFWIQSSEVQDNIVSFATGATNQIELSRAVIASMIVPIAPLSEQKRIVDKLDALLTRVDVCHDRLKRTSHILKQFRQSIFNSATSGELTSERSSTSKYALWQEVLIGDLLVEKPRNGYSPKAVEFETTTRSLTLTATTSGRFNPTHVKYIDEKIPENSYLWLEPDDILIQRANSFEYVGVSAIYDGLSKAYIFPDLMIKCKANNRVLTKFLYFLLSSDNVRSYFRKNATGTTGNMPKINQQTVMSAPVVLPSLEEQQEIVRRADILLIYVDRLELFYESAFAKVHQLRSSILSKAFCGDLVPQNALDEPASILLERIRIKNSEVTSNKTRLSKPKSDKSFKSKSQSKIVMLKRKNIKFSHLSDILKANGSMLAETLWLASQLDIDDFYDQLKSEEAKGLLQERKDKSIEAPRLLEAV